jgi:hypothetical protein
MTLVFVTVLALFLAGHDDWFFGLALAWMLQPNLA